MNVLKVSNLKVEINKKVLLKGLNLEFQSGHVYALIGPNGAGKSTLLKSIVNLLDKTIGEFHLNNINLKKLDRMSLAKVAAYMPQFTNSSSALNVQEVLSLGRRAYNKLILSDEDHKRIADVAVQFEISNRLGNSVASLSGGERQKVFIASILLQEPDILLLDEPISHLDPKNQHEMLEIIKNHTKKINLITIIVLHDIHHALHYSDAIIMLKDGNLCGIKRPYDIDCNDIKTLFDMPVSMHEINGHKFIYYNPSNG